MMPNHVAITILLAQSVKSMLGVTRKLRGSSARIVKSSSLLDHLLVNSVGLHLSVGRPAVQPHLRDLLPRGPTQVRHRPGP